MGITMERGSMGQFGIEESQNAKNSVGQYPYDGEVSELGDKEREVIRFAIGECSLGVLLVAATGKGVCLISFHDNSEELIQDVEKRFASKTLVLENEELNPLIAQVLELIEHPGMGASFPLDAQGSAFQNRVWKALNEIPPGKTMSYSEIARSIGAPNSSRAVAHACAANPLAVAIPCHRALRSDGGLAGYRWGIERKRTLLDREKGYRPKINSSEVPEF
ncbi:MAG: hypothetical protein B6D68_03140 [spirochete symbiont of Stewartia floridana]|nr:MAG: hypothetical protein B6D68_03140 [spirochete symbiont of Stewartia floridana]